MHPAIAAPGDARTGNEPQAAARLLARGEADQALTVLGRRLATNAKDALALNLQCRVLYAEQRATDAEKPCTRAAQLAPGVSSYHLWLGRVLGVEAEHASLFSAYGLARQVRAEFEAAHQLDPHDAGAAADLGRFYVEAPRFVGGGQAKAQALANEVEVWSPALAHTLRAELAQSAKDPAAAETEWKAAAASRDARPDEWVTLAAFERKQNRIPEMLTALDRAIALDTAQDDALVAAARELMHSGQRLSEAATLLRSYLASPNQSEGAPAFVVHAELARVLAQMGDTGGADQEMAAARALATGWQPHRGNRQGPGSDRQGA
ncbi:hypothetical protein [Acidipila sp. EB88]|uniref:hypothetical protein n=1 Tax=Acidipila sp. EB88 TaxID=2305226 RepID=UPI000F5DA571|nr:hypothetical protein [Acidipila sp. EB88]RRA49469.1 hypothetical protein D1Y84_15515 [Acidipila sp. EB88]